jgi:hypothetical protein
MNPNLTVLPQLCIAAAEVIKPKIQHKQKPVPSTQPKPSLNESVTTFSENEIRTRAYHIYEPGNRNASNAAADWNQAEVELIELIGGK